MTKSNDPVRLLAAGTWRLEPQLVTCERVIQICMSGGSWDLVSAVGFRVDGFSLQGSVFRGLGVYGLGFRALGV